MAEETQKDGWYPGKHLKVGKTWLRENLTLRDVFICLLIAAGLLNIIQFRDIEGHTSRRYGALTRYDTADIIPITQNESPDVRTKYNLSFAMGARFPNRIIIIPSGQMTRDLHHSLASFGRAARILGAKYDPRRLLDGLDYAGFMVASGSGGHRYLPFVIAAKTKNPKGFIYLEHPTGGQVLLDLALVPKSVLKTLVPGSVLTELMQ